MLPLCSGGTPPPELHPVLGPPVQERCGFVKEGSDEGRKNALSAGAPLLWREAESWDCAAWTRGSPDCGLLINNSSLWEAWKENLPSTDRTRGNGFSWMKQDLYWALGIHFLQWWCGRSCPGKLWILIIGSVLWFHEYCNFSHEIQVSLVLNLLTDWLQSGMSACTELLVIPDFLHCKRKELSKESALSGPLYAGTCTQQMEMFIIDIYVRIIKRRSKFHE